VLVRGVTTGPRQHRREPPSVPALCETDYRYVVEGGNCALFAFRKFIDLITEGYRPKLQACVLELGEGHAFVTVDGWVLDNRFDRVVRRADEVGLPANEPKRC
jgi:hypothetical protein